MTDQEIMKLAKSGLPHREVADRLMKAGISVERYGKVLNKDLTWFLVKLGVFTLIVCGIMLYVTFFVL